MRRALLALALLFLISHAACLPATFEDVDAINFALGVRDFDVARHQPHPPGYPVFIAAAKASTAALGAIGVPAAEVRGLAILSAVSGALLLPLLFMLCRTLVACPERAPDQIAEGRVEGVWTAVVVVTSPLFWFNALRPLSDLTGLAGVVLAQTLLAAVILRGSSPERAARRLMIGAFVAGLAIGVRSQSFVLTLPLLALALAAPRSRLSLWDRLLAVAALTAGALLWAVPLLVTSGGLEAYLVALANQAGEDFTGVVMLWTTRTPRVAIDAIGHSFLWPWGTVAAGGVVTAIAAGGALRMLRRAPGAFGTLLVAFAPYAGFHLLFQETLTTRYALPLVIPVALLAVYALAGLGRYAVHAGCTALAVWSLVVSLPAGRAYGSRPTPPASALRDALAGSSPQTAIGMHAVMLRPEQWYHDNASGRVIRQLHGREVAALVNLWRGRPDATVLFMADPRRSDLAMLDPRSRELTRSFNWGFPEFPLLGGVRPGEIALFNLRPPGWMLDEGWAITAEVGGQTERLGAGPHRRPATAWVRSRQVPSMLLLGGRNLGPTGSDPARISIASGSRVIHSFVAPPGFFLERLPLPADVLSGPDAYVPIHVTAVGSGAQDVRVGLEQFDLQWDAVPMLGLGEGWQEPEYNPTTGRTWRWMSERATLWVRSVGRDVTLTLSAESPRRYFDTSPALRVVVGGQTIAQLSPSADFTWEVKIPAGLLASGNENVTIESDKSFVAGGGDQRNLALRVYAVEVN